MVFLKFVVQDSGMRWKRAVFVTNCVFKHVYLCEWGLLVIWYTYAIVMCLSCMWFFVCLGASVSVFVSGMDITLNNVLCLLLSWSHPVVFRHFATEGPGCWIWLRIGCRFPLCSLNRLCSCVVCCWKMEVGDEAEPAAGVSVISLSSNCSGAWWD